MAVRWYQICPGCGEEIDDVDWTLADWHFWCWLKAKVGCLLMGHEWETVDHWEHDAGYDTQVCTRCKATYGIDAW